MTQIHLAGPGGPIPTIALPDPNISDDLPTTELVLENGVPFAKLDYVNLGYTHAEVWVVAAAGGLGPNAANPTFSWSIAQTFEVMPGDVYTAWVEWLVYSGGDRNAYAQRGHWEPYPPGPGRPSPPSAWLSYAIANGEWWMSDGPDYTLYQWAAHINPAGTYPVRTYSSPVLSDPGNDIGGGGGGGGVHVVTVLLADLPALTPVVIGQAAADAPFAQVNSSGVYTPLPNDPPLRPYGESGNTNPATWSPILMPWANRYPGAHASFPPIGPGLPGGASSFGDVAMASGGKGGNGAKKWVGSTLTADGNGGDGGLGGQSTPGGGGLGSPSKTETGKDGGWDGLVGGGGGGGHGGKYVPAGGGFGGGSATITAATDGGRGSFNYGDTSVWGQKQIKQTLTVGSLTHGPIIPGGGGGVRANHKNPVGSDAAGYSPNGAVILRLLKID